MDYGNPAQRFTRPRIHVRRSKSPSAGHRSILGLSETKEVVLILKDCTLVLLVVDVPLWPLLLLLLIAPIRWLIARPANAPAFPVIAKARQK